MTTRKYDLLNDPSWFDGQRLLSQNDLYNVKIKCTKFEVSTSITFEVMKIKQGNEMTLNDP